MAKEKNILYTELALRRFAEYTIAAQCVKNQLDLLNVLLPTLTEYEDVIKKTTTNFRR